MTSKRPESRPAENPRPPAGSEPATQNWRNVEPGSIDCVFLTRSAREVDEASRLLARTSIHVHHAVTLEQARGTLIATGARVLMAEVAFLDGSWEDAEAMLVHFHPPVVLVVVATQVDERFWILVLERGAFDLIQRPFDAEELRRILENAHALASRTEVRHRGATG